MRWAAILAALLAVPATGQDALDSPGQVRAITESCRATSDVQARRFEQVPATVTPLSPATLPITGRLRARWGLRITTHDPRVANLAGLEVSNAYGLLAVTRGRQWLTFSLRNDTLAAIRTVGVGTMRQAPGVPTSLVQLLNGPTLVAFEGAKAAVALYGLIGCGAAATAVPWIDIAGAASPLIVEAADLRSVVLVGRRAGGGSALTRTRGRASVALTGRNPLARRGETLIAASNPARIVPEIIVARRDRGGRTEVALVPVEAWDDVRGGPRRPEMPLATLPRAPSAMATYWNSRTEITLVILAYPGPRAGMVDLYAFDTDIVA